MKKIFKGLLFLAPVLIIAAWLLVYLILLPIAYGQVVTFTEWVLADPTVIIDMLKDANNILIPIYIIILLRIYNWLTVVGVIICFFFIGRSIQKKKPKQNMRAKLHGNEPYIITLGFLEEIKITGNKDAEKAVYLLNDRLRNESAFGEGGDPVINYENEIKGYLDDIRDLIFELEQENTAAEAARKIDLLCQRCTAKLKLRTELKKK